MPIAIDPKKTWDYILKAERESESPTVFHLATLTVAEEAALQDKLVAVKDGAAQVASGTHTLEVLRIGLVGWSGFRFCDGTEAPFKTDPGRKVRGRAMVSDESLDLLAPADRKELAEAIVERNTIGEADRKNSQSAPVS